MLHRQLDRKPKAIACRVATTLYGEKVEACIDTGATYSLLSETVYEHIKDKCPPLQPARVRLHGAGGQDIPLLGVATIHVKIAETTYHYPVHVGGLKSVGLLLGLDWLVDHSALLDFAKMTVTVGPRQVIHIGESVQLVTLQTDTVVEPHSIAAVRGTSPQQLNSSGV